MSREYLPKALGVYQAWRKWEAIWSWTNILLGGLSIALGALVAANAKGDFFGTKCQVIFSVAAPIFTFVLTTLKPQAKAAAFETASRELEKARYHYEADPTKDDVFLVEGIGRGIDILNKVGSS